MTTPVRYYIVRDEDQPVVRLVAVDVRTPTAGEPIQATTAPAVTERRAHERARPSFGRVVKAAARRARNNS